jgi:hypothetical protein
MVVELNRSKFDEIIRNDSRVREYIPEESWPDPALPDDFYSLWAPERREFQKELHGGIFGLLRRGYIVDDFENETYQHISRRTWRETHDKYSPGFYATYRDSNSLRFNTLLALRAVYNVSRGYNGTNPDELEHKIDEVEDMFRIQVMDTLNGSVSDLMNSSYYDKHTTIEKIDFVKKVKEKTYGIYEFLAKQVPLYKVVSEEQPVVIPFPDPLDMAV